MDTLTRPVRGQGSGHEQDRTELKVPFPYRIETLSNTTVLRVDFFRSHGQAGGDGTRHTDVLCSDLRPVDAIDRGRARKGNLFAKGWESRRRKSEKRKLNKTGLQSL